MLPLDPQALPEPGDVSILIVDDDPVVLEIMKSFVASYGYRFATAANGREAAAILEKEPFSIVVTDIKMPHMDGVELLRHIKSRHPRTGVIVVTGLGDQYSYVDVIREGAIDFMAKPFDGQEFQAKLQRAVREQTLIKELEKLSVCDSLTGLYNRRYFDRKIADEAHRAARQQDNRIFLALIDVDNFKAYNDTYGHQAGDNLLATLGGIMRRCARRGVDWAFRYGGDEFAVIITQANREQSLKVCERIIVTFRKYDFGGTTLSAGLAAFRHHPGRGWRRLISEVVQDADRALYSAKKAGRDRIVTA